MTTVTTVYSGVYIYVTCGNLEKRRILNMHIQLCTRKSIYIRETSVVSDVTLWK